METLDGLEATTDDKSRDVAAGRDESARDTQVLCALPKNGPVSDMLHRIDDSKGLVIGYVAAVAAWWVAMTVMGAPMTVPILVPLAATRSMLPVPTSVVAVACTALGIAWVTRLGEMRFPCLVALTVIAPSTCAIWSNEILLDGVGELGRWVPYAVMVGVLLFVTEVALDGFPRRPLERAASLAVAVLVMLMMASLMYPSCWKAYGQRGYLDDGESQSLASRASELEGRWDDASMDGRSQLCEDYLFTASGLLGLRGPLPLVVEVGPLREARLGEDEVFGGQLPVVSLCDVASPSEGAMLGQLDALTARVALSRLDDPLRALSPDTGDPTASAWARTADGERYRDELGDTLDEGEEGEYVEAVASLLAYARNDGSVRG